MILNKADLKGKINAGLLHKISENNFEVKTCNPIEFITPKRFDLIAKYIFIKYSEANIKSNFHEDLYLRHIEVLNGFFEADGSNKIGAKAFLKSFKSLIKSVREEGLNEDLLIPVNNNILIDGAHRLATILFFEEKAKFISVDIKQKSFDYDYFLNSGLERVYLDTMALEYINLKKKNLYLAFIWPTSGGKHESKIKKIFSKYGEIVYRKSFNLSKTGELNLIRNLYKNERWVGSSSNRFIGAQNKANWCFEKKGSVRVILFESTGPVTKLKDEIRDLFKVNKHSIHITDTFHEVEEFSKLVFNDNTIHWMNFSTRNEYKWFNQLLVDYTQWIDKNKYDLSKFCIDGSATLSAYGIRSARDLDFFYSDTERIITGIREIDCHNDRLKNDTQQIHDQIFNPRNYFYYKSIKLISLDRLYEYKQSRGETKDIQDTNKINDLINNKSRKTLKRFLIIFNIVILKARIKFMLMKIRYYFLKAIKDVKI